MRSHLSDLSLLLLRLSGIAMAAYHGQGKVASLASGEGERLIQGAADLGFPLPVVFAWAAALSEFIGGLLIAVGLGTRIAAGFLAFTMAVAAFGRHRAFHQLLAALGVMNVDAETLKSWGKPESALIYLVVCLALLLTGPGRYSVDHLIGKRIRRSRD
jgi:putative oxidoreductase